MSRTKTLLNGVWQLQPSNDETPPSRWDHSVAVPALVDIAEPRCDWKSFKYHYHRATFSVKERAEVAFIIIEQAMFGTDVWLNGKYLGGNIACYTSQEYDARPALHAGSNELCVRVGQRENLPSHSAAGKDQERTEWIPGIWGDVYLLQCGNPRVKRVQVIPHCTTSTAEVRCVVENLSARTLKAVLSTTVREKTSRDQVGKTQDRALIIAPDSCDVVIVSHEIPGMHLWSPESPFLYELESRVSLLEPQIPDLKPSVDSCAVVFGMREFRIAGRHFFLNNKKILLRGGNIAFHRFLSDADRGVLPWDTGWVKKLLIDIPRQHNFNFFRSHIGQLYNRWYDIADEHGMLLQNEWMFWTTTGTKEQITKEFTRWLQDNWNHPSIVIWDALNECWDEVVQKEIIPGMKQLDPTRPWESVDVLEEHPYIYSLGPVLNDRQFGFTRSLDAIEHSMKPTMVNEFCWWWIDKDLNPSLLTEDVVERWLGPKWTKEELLAHQSFLVTELVELFRRMGVDAIQPFVYLSNNAGPTANWFLGNIRELQPKPILAALKNAFAPFGVSIELWDRHFFPGERRTIRVFVFNDHPAEKEGKMRCGIVNDTGDWSFETLQPVRVPPSSMEIVSMPTSMPSQPGEYRMRSELLCDGVAVSYSDKILHVVSPSHASPRLKDKRCAILSPNGELGEFLAEKGVETQNLEHGTLGACSLLVVGEGMLGSPAYQSRLGAITRFLQEGKTVIVLEPEFEVGGRNVFEAALGVEITIERREDSDKGGYDSYVFADDISHPIWKGIPQEHLKMFNGAYGGEVVSQHNLIVPGNGVIHARCGMKLAVIALCELPVGRGRLIISRIQTRGRLIGDDSQDLFARRKDPVAQRYLLNMLSYGVS